MCSTLSALLFLENEPCPNFWDIFAIFMRDAQCVCARSVNAKTPIFHFRPFSRGPNLASLRYRLQHPRLRRTARDNRAHCSNKPIITRRVSLARSKSGFLGVPFCIGSVACLARGPSDMRAKRTFRRRAWHTLDFNLNFASVALSFPFTAFFVFGFLSSVLVATWIGDSGRAERAHQDFEDGNPK